MSHTESAFSGLLDVCNSCGARHEVRYVKHERWIKPPRSMPPNYSSRDLLPDNNTTAGCGCGNSVLIPGRSSITAEPHNLADPNKAPH